eukprot:4356007-Amphidinium_carterae.1
MDVSSPRRLMQRALQFTTKHVQNMAGQNQTNLGQLFTRTNQPHDPSWWPKTSAGNSTSSIQGATRPLKSSTNT